MSATGPSARWYCRTTWMWTGPPAAKAVPSGGVTERTERVSPFVPGSDGEWPPQAAASAPASARSPRRRAEAALVLPRRERIIVLLPDSASPAMRIVYEAVENAQPPPLLSAAALCFAKAARSSCLLGGSPRGLLVSAGRLAHRGEGGAELGVLGDEQRLHGLDEVVEGVRVVAIAATAGEEEVLLGLEQLRRRAVGDPGLTVLAEAGQPGHRRQQQGGCHHQEALPAAPILGMADRHRHHHAEHDDPALQPHMHLLGAVGGFLVVGDLLLETPGKILFDVDRHCRRVFRPGRLFPGLRGRHVLLPGRLPGRASAVHEALQAGTTDSSISRLRLVSVQRTLWKAPPAPGSRLPAFHSPSDTPRKSRHRSSMS